LVLGIVTIVFAQRSSRLVLGDLDFRALQTDNMASEIAENGPILWPDVAGGNRDLWLQHLGADPAAGWTAFDARQSGTPRQCNVRWEDADQQFVDPCKEGVAYPADGAGLPPIPVYLDGRELIIDINGVRDPADFAGYTPSG
ncbi:MAG: hypothetical protein ACR2P0_11620, partial [Acidimicrobiales bacterium]